MGIIIINRMPMRLINSFVSHELEASVWTHAWRKKFDSVFNGAGLANQLVSRINIRLILRLMNPEGRTVM